MTINTDMLVFMSRISMKTHMGYQAIMSWKGDETIDSRNQIKEPKPYRRKHDAKRGE